MNIMNPIEREEYDCPTLIAEYDSGQLYSSRYWYRERLYLRVDGSWFMHCSVRYNPSFNASHSDEFIRALSKMKVMQWLLEHDFLEAFDEHWEALDRPSPQRTE
jgi:hypothetical protein